MGNSGPVFFVVLIILSTGSGSQYLKWSNENCEADEECYSKECSKAHHGTESRCSRGSVMMPCFAAYHCEAGLDCGDNNACCSPYWGICLERKQCCDTSHVCRPGDGYNYNRCLLPISAAKQHISNLIVLTSGFFWLVLR